jgi:hypothetical protein
VKAWEENKTQVEKSSEKSGNSWIEGIWKFEWWKFVFDNWVEDTDENWRLFITFNWEKYTKFSNLGLKDWESWKVYQESKDWIYFGEVRWGEYKKSWSWTMLFSNWDTFTWNWENNLPNWEGTLIKNGGSRFSWIWENGKLVNKSEDWEEKVSVVSESRIDYANAQTWNERAQEIANDLSEKGFNAQVVEVKKS